MEEIRSLAPNYPIAFQGTDIITEYYTSKNFCSSKKTTFFCAKEAVENTFADLITVDSLIDFDLGGNGYSTITIPTEAIVVEIDDLDAGKVTLATIRSLRQQGLEHVADSVKKIYDKWKRTNLANVWHPVKDPRKELTGSRVVEWYGAKRCMSNNIPSYMAECLLKGLRTEIKPRWETDTVRAVGGFKLNRPRYGVSIVLLANIGLMDRTEKRMATRFKTNYFGYVLLKHWASKRKNFKPFYDAYITRKIEKDLKVEMMMKE